MIKAKSISVGTSVVEELTFDALACLMGASSENGPAKGLHSFPSNISKMGESLEY